MANPKRKVVTRDGRNVRIVCTDRQGGDRPILILCFESDGIERCFSCFPNGRRYVDIDSCMDLFFAPEKRSGWINLLRNSCGEVFISSTYPYEDEKTTKLEASNRSNVVATCKITWEE